MLRRSEEIMVFFLSVAVCYVFCSQFIHNVVIVSGPVNSWIAMMDSAFKTSENSFSHCWFSPFFWKQEQSYQAEIPFWERGVCLSPFCGMPSLTYVELVLLSPYSWLCKLKNGDRTIVQLNVAWLWTFQTLFWSKRVQEVQSQALLMSTMCSSSKSFKWMLQKIGPEILT
jgi:hypothetical protein